MSGHAGLDARRARLERRYLTGTHDVLVQRARAQLAKIRRVKAAIERWHLDEPSGDEDDTDWAFVLSEAEALFARFPEEVRTAAHGPEEVP